MSDTTFLTEDEIKEFTGIRRGKGSKTYCEMQVEWMQRQGYPARLNAAGRPVIARSAIEGAKANATPKPQEWTSDAWR